ncbi:MAG: ABC transporter substrate-binding protein [Rhodospirillales bacterium]|nr:ABC transporter substrate-binding protein [Rhodospirillales bacterium]
MIRLRCITPSRRAFLAGLAIMAFAPHPSLGDSSTDATAFIAGLSDQAIASLTTPGISREEREARARALLNDYFAVQAIAQFVLGRYWRTASAEERAEYLRLFEQLIVVTYVDRFSRYSGERLRVINAVADADSGDVTVNSEITRPAGAPVQVGWRIRRMPPSLKIIDVVVEGVSMGQTQRSDFASVIRNNGGTMTALLDEMRRRVQQPT